MIYITPYKKVGGGLFRRSKYEKSGELYLLVYEGDKWIDTVYFGCSEYKNNLYKLLNDGRIYIDVEASLKVVRIVGTGCDKIEVINTSNPEKSVTIECKMSEKMPFTLFAEISIVGKITKIGKKSTDLLGLKSL